MEQSNKERSDESFSDKDDRLLVHGKAADKPFTYPIVWKKDFDSLAEEISGIEDLHPGKICIVTDSHVGPLFLYETREALRRLPGVEVYSWTFEAGEERKNLNTVQELYRFLIENHFERRDLIAALGGGVTGDLAGFAAATYLRGIDFIQIPTSLLAQVDSSVGGKTGVDFDEFKNMVGAFHQPRLVYMNMSALRTLPDEQFVSGMGEIVKSAEIRDASFFQWLEDNSWKINDRDDNALTTMVRECCRIKATVVEEDPTEKGVRAILNFGHTLGHAVEKCRNFELLHGQCVGIGIIGASWLSMKRGLLSEKDYERVVWMNKTFGLPTAVEGLTAEEILQATKSDKKMEHGHVKFILLDGIGNAVIDRTVTDEEILEAAKEIISTGENHE